MIVFNVVLLVQVEVKFFINFFECYLIVWVVFCIVVGIVFGQVLFGLFQQIGWMEYVQVNFLVGLLIWVMIILMLVKVDFGVLYEVWQYVRGIGVMFVVNWFVKLFLMVFFGWFFICYLFVLMLFVDQFDSYIVGLILLVVVLCIVMVFVWSWFMGGDLLFMLFQVVLNDSIMVIVFVLLVGLFLGMFVIMVLWVMLLILVVFYIVILVIFVQIWCKVLFVKG